jgi:predicted MPP superfamily phosphohydrolase
MLTRAIHFLRYLFWLQPVEVLTSVAFFCIAGIVAGTGTLFVRRQQRTRALSPDGIRAGLGLLFFLLADWALLRALPGLQLSFSTEIALPLLASTTIRLAMLWGLVSASMLTRWRARRRGTQGSMRAATILFLVCNLAFSAIQVDAYVVEPLWVDHTELTLAFEDLDPASPPVRVIHLTDVHIERGSYREARILQKVNALQPDIIVLTGDYLNLSRLDDPVSAKHFRQFVSQLSAPYGIYAVRGSVEPTPESMAWLVEGTDVVWLEQETVTVDVRGQQVTLVGVACSHRQNVDTARLAQAMADLPKDAFTLLLYHSPDLIAQAAEHQADLYLGGHTHGGQLRLPVYGAMVTASMYGKRYEAGLFKEGDTRMYISRGIGFEGGGMPRARFLCRPEIVSLELGGAN